MELDTSTDFGARVAKRLHEEQIIWLVTIGADGTPQPSPVWFVWDGATMLIYSKPNVPKIANLARHPNVALHFDGDGWGGDIIVFTGTAQVAPGATPAKDFPAYVAKYSAGIERIGMNADSFSAAYTTAIRVTPTKVRGH